MQLNGTPPPSVSLWDLSPWSSLQSCVSLGTGPEFHHMLETLSAHLTPHTDPPEGLPSSVESSGITSVHPALHVGSLREPHTFFPKTPPESHSGKEFPRQGSKASWLPGALSDPGSLPLSLALVSPLLAPGLPSGCPSLPLGSEHMRLPRPVRRGSG